MNKKEKYLIAIAGLLHDIGKFYQRATNQKTSNQDKEDFRYAHAILSYTAINQELKEGLESVFSQQELNTILDGCYHHKPTTPIQHLLQKADWVSSSERLDQKTVYDLEVLSPDQKQDLEKFAKENPRLRSIFESLDLGKEYKKKNYFYKVAPLNLSKDIFPKDLEITYGQILNKETDKEKELGSYQDHWKRFKEEFNQKLKNADKFEKNPEKIFSLIYHLLYKYLWCIPASTYDKENQSNHYPDISLFDHSRILSAVACCFYDYDKEGFTQESINEFQNKFKDKEVFLHIKGDISGIQKFIYNVYPGKRGTAKTLRGRSFYVSLLPEIISRYILNQLEYPISNLLYSGGGIFELLVANTQENLNKILQIKQEVEEFLTTKFEADLGVAIGYYQYSPIQMKEYKTVLRKLNENLDNAKKQKFISLIDSGDIFKLLNNKVNSLKSNKKRCPVCKTYLIDENLQDEEEICQVCETFRKIGQYLPKTNYLAFAKSQSINFVDTHKIINFGKFGSVYLIDENNIKDLQPLFLDPEVVEILAINDTSLNRYTTGFKFIGKTVPEALKDVIFEDEDDKIDKGQIVPFSYLAQFSEGDDRIGILRMDVDNLGKLFSEGLKDKISISRIATLSRSLDLFFSGYLNKICEDLTLEYKNQKYKDAEIKNFFYILYSGGDDVFLIAPWDKTIDIAIKINQEFKNYTCHNPNITLSAGYIQTKHKYPIRFAADLAGEAEEVAKSSGKNRICILGDILNWNEIDSLRKTAEEWINYIQNKKLQRGFIYAVHKLKEQFLKDLNSSSKIAFPYREEGKEDLMFYPYAQYYIARNIDKDLRENISKFLLNTQNFRKLTFLVNYVSLKTRN